MHQTFLTNKKQNVNVLRVQPILNTEKYVLTSKKGNTFYYVRIIQPTISDSNNFFFVIILGLLILRQFVNNLKYLPYIIQTGYFNTVYFKISTVLTTIHGNKRTNKGLELVQPLYGIALPKRPINSISDDRLCYVTIYEATYQLFLPSISSIQ